MTQSPGPRLIERALDVLIALSDGPTSFTSVCRTVELSKATVHRILSGLSYQGFVVQNPLTNEYMLGPGMYRVGRGLTEPNGGLAALLRRVLTGLSEESGETAVLHVIIGQERVCVVEVESPNALRYVVGVGASAPLYVGAAGKALIAWSDERELKRLLPAELTARTEMTITDHSILTEELAAVRAQGWAESRGERIVGAFAYSAPVFGDARRVVASLSVLGPDVRLTPSRAIEIRRMVVRAAAEATRLMSATSGPDDESSDGSKDASEVAALG